MLDVVAYAINLVYVCRKYRRCDLTRYECRNVYGRAATACLWRCGLDIFEIMDFLNVKAEGWEAKRRA